MVIKMNVPKLRFNDFNDDYVINTFDNLINIIDGDRGNNYPKASDFYGDEYCLFLNAGNVTKKGFNFSNKYFITFKKDNELKNGKLKRNDVVLTTRGTVGNVALYDYSIPFENIRINSGMVINRIKNDKILLPQYLYRFMQSTYFEYQIKKTNFGSAQPQLTKSGITKFTIAYPCVKEQSKVSIFLSLLDKKIELQSQKIEALKLYKKGLLLNYFKGKKTNKIIKNIIKYGKAGGTPKSSVKEYYNGKIPFLSISDMTKQGKYIYNTERNISEIGLKNSSAWLVPEDSIILSMYASYGLVAINKIKLSTSQAMFNMILNDNVFVEYIYQYLNYLNISNYYDKLISTGTQSNLNAEKIYNIKIFIPEFNEQKLIANLLNCIDILIEFNIKKKKNYHKLKKGLMQNMFV